MSEIDNFRHLISRIHIQNFKSIKFINTEVKRINLFIGRPNSGKSNILEALSTLYNGNIALYGDAGIRYKVIADIFRDKDRRNDIYVYGEGIDLGHYFNMSFDSALEKYDLKLRIRGNPELLIDKNIDSEIIYESSAQYDLFSNPASTSRSNSIPNGFPFIVYYKFAGLDFDTNIKYDSFINNRLMPYNGRNIKYIFEYSMKLQDRIGSLLAQYDLEALIDDDKIRIFKKLNNVLIKFDLNLIADSLQRLLFYLAAIYSNKSATLLFEEPEVHSYPPYISTLATEIAEAKTNQFFIATHSPYLINTLWNDAGSEEVQIFLTEYIDHQTIVTPLDPGEVQFVMENNGDLLLNLDSFSKQ